MEISSSLLTMKFNLADTKSYGAKSDVMRKASRQPRIELVSNAQFMAPRLTKCSLALFFGSGCVLYGLILLCV